MKCASQTVVGARNRVWGPIVTLFLHLSRFSFGTWEKSVWKFLNMWAHGTVRSVARGHGSRDGSRSGANASSHVRVPLLNSRFCKGIL